jgi:hypothetical protein
MGSPVNSVIKIVRSFINIKNKYYLKEPPCCNVKKNIQENLLGNLVEGEESN